MKSILATLAILTSISLNAQYERIFSPWSFEFEVGSVEFMYGDNVVLRDTPQADANAVDTLSIGDPVKIIQKSKMKMKFRGVEWNWYEVQYGSQKGFVLGGLIAVDYKRFEGNTYLLSYVENDDKNAFARCRVLKSDGEFYGHEVPLGNSAFNLQVMNNRGVENIESIVYINYFAEACGVDGGGIYLFNDGERLIRAIEVSEIGDGGVFWYSEELKFPWDDEGIKGQIIYEEEHGEALDEEGYQFKTSGRIIYMEWKDGAFHPNPSELKDSEE